MRSRLLILWLGASLCGASGGCSGNGETFVSVRGQVTVNGKPLTIGSVSLRPDAARGNASLHHPTGAIGKDGRYEVTTAKKKGAPPGWYKVLIFADENLAKGIVHPLPPIWATHVKYTREETTDVSIEVTASTEVYDLKLVR